MSSQEGNTATVQVGRMHFDAYGGTYPAALYAFDAVVPVIDGFDGVTAGDLDRDGELGYLAIDHAFTPKIAAAVRQALCQLMMSNELDPGCLQFEWWAMRHMATLTTEQKVNAVRKFTHFNSKHRRLYDLAYDKRLISLVSRLMGGPGRKCCREWP